jgi:tRNA-splicing endonuclease subunit Sen34
MAPVTVTEPFPISYIRGAYLLFDVDAVAHARRAHNICGVLIGTIPNLSQQNVFLGLPLQLMPEEARVLVEGGHAYIVDDADVHQKGFMQMGRDERLKYLRDMDEQGRDIAEGKKRLLEEKAVRALREKGLVPRTREGSVAGDVKDEAGEDESLFGDAASMVSMPKSKVEPHFVTPTTSYPPLSPPSVESGLPLPAVPRSYPLFKHMNSKGYFAMPGLRFGCQYTVYPGDPLRFHSHFLATGLDWDEEFDLLDIVGGGRLGTGVKKAYLVGGEDPSIKAAGGEDDQVQAFSIEWAGL